MGYIYKFYFYKKEQKMDSIIKIVAFFTAVSGAYFAGNKSSHPMGVVIPLVDDVEIESAEK
tara:strand:+ start:501 stop:683 length:183 start_codon:yes stop_codon:yes gene_type:complete